MAEERRMLNRMEQVHDISVLELFNWATEQGIDPATAKVTHAHVRWQSPATDEEQARYMQRVLESDRRREAWERDAYVRLHAIYGPGGTHHAGG